MKLPLTVELLRQEANTFVAIESTYADSLMPRSSKPKAKTEFGDFQTPDLLARDVCALLVREGVNPASILEPTCGVGNFLLAAVGAFPNAKKLVGVDINPKYVAAARERLGAVATNDQVAVLDNDFFTMDWPALVSELPDPLLVIGNPPWVTNAALGELRGSNLPHKTNFKNHRGIDAVTGKSNFDISEWMLIRMIEWTSNRQATLAMLCKTATARKALVHAWEQQAKLERTAIYRIDALKFFEAAVDACLLVVRGSRSQRSIECDDYPSLTATAPSTTFGLRDGFLVADVAAYEQWKHLQGRKRWGWRSGIKHDCAKVLELRRVRTHYQNGLGHLVELEPDYLFPLLKSSEVANSREVSPSRWMLVPQRSVGEDTRPIQLVAPKTWAYLNQNAEHLDRRASRIYRNRPRFSIFGVGDYSFAPWKVAISGLYKKIRFKAVGPFQGKPVVLDDTCYFLLCESEQDARQLCRILNSDMAKGFFSAFVFWDAKRPITAELLERLDLIKLSAELGEPSPIISTNSIFQTAQLFS